MAGHPHFLRQWRKYKSQTLEQVAARLHTTHATLSRIERGKLPYSQQILEGLAEEYGTDPASLLSRDPAVEPPTVLDNLTAGERIQVAAFIEAIRKSGANE